MRFLLVLLTLGAVVALADSDWRRENREIRLDAVRQARQARVEARQVALEARNHVREIQRQIREEAREAAREARRAANDWRRNDF